MLLTIPDLGDKVDKLVTEMVAHYSKIYGLGLGFKKR